MFKLRMKKVLVLPIILIGILSCSLATENKASQNKASNARDVSYPAWNADSIYVSGSKVIHTEHLWEAKWWNQGKEPGGDSDTAGVWLDLGDPGSGQVTKPEVLVEHNQPGELKATIFKDEENETTFSGRILLENPNTAYVWNESYFTIWDIQFETSSTITDIRSTNGAVSCTKNGDIVKIDLGWQSLIGYGKEIELIYTAAKGGSQVFPKNFKVNYVRGDKAQMYPTYQGLPSTFVKGSTSYTLANLVENQANYYQTNATPTTSDFIVYNPDHNTQIRIGQTTVTDYNVNTVSNVRIWIPSKYMAMGIATVYEFFKINPNYMAALGTKENFSAGVVPPEAGVTMNPVTIDGNQYYWPIVLGHVDGPYQQEVGNFNDAKIYFVDYLGEEAKHTNFTQVMTQHDPKWISATISSGLSISVTRETLAAVKNTGYKEFIETANDPWAEFAIVTYAYNRGVSMFFSKKLFTDNRAEALATPDIPSTFDMGGFGGHVPTVKAITKAMNNDTSDIYDVTISWAEMESYFTQLRKFYAKNVPTDAEWSAMLADVNTAFNTLSAQWGGNTIKYRYDFLTLLRVAQEHLPDVNPRPTGNQWYYIIKNAKP